MAYLNARAHQRRLATPAPAVHTPTNAARHERQSALSVQVCDGCCCGTERKHPGVDHAGIRELLAAAIERAGGHMRIVGCVDECSRSNVVIVRPSGSGSGRTWIGDVLDDDVVHALCGWIATGATAPQPPDIAARVFHRTKLAPVGSDAEPVAVQLRVAR